MENTLKILLKKNTAGHIGNMASIIPAGKAGVEEIIAGMQQDGMSMDPSVVMEIITQFNRKAAEMATAGYDVNTGLVHLRPVIKTYAYRNTWNSAGNIIGISVSEGKEIYHALNETPVEIQNENPETADDYTGCQESTYWDERSYDSRNPLLNTKEVPACGMAFRAWLCKS